MVDGWMGRNVKINNGRSMMGIEKAEQKRLERIERS